MFASNEADLAFLLPIILIFGPVMIGCLIAALIGGMSREEKKRRLGGKLLIVGGVAAVILLASPWITKVLHSAFHE